MLSNIIINTLMYSAPLIFGALGGVLSERCGVINIGIEGMMFCGAFTAAAVGFFAGDPWLGFLAGGLAGALLAFLHAVACVTFKADQTVSGIALNLMGPGFSLFFCRLLFGGLHTKVVPRKLPKIPGLNVDIIALLAIIATLLLWFVLYKTKWGLRIRAIGEHPAAADTLGVNVTLTQYSCVVLSGLLAGMGGGCVTLATIANFSQTSISGQGFIALAAVIFGKWTPLGAYCACLLFGFSQVLVVTLGGEGCYIPSEILAMLPYVLTILILILFVGRAVSPKANGKPYEKGSR